MARRQHHRPAKLHAEPTGGLVPTERSLSLFFSQDSRELAALAMNSLSSIARVVLDSATVAEANKRLAGCSKQSAEAIGMLETTLSAFDPDALAVIRHQAVAKPIVEATPVQQTDEVVTVNHAFEAGSITISLFTKLRDAALANNVEEEKLFGRPSFVAVKRADVRASDLLAIAFFGVHERVEVRSKKVVAAMAVRAVEAVGERQEAVRLWGVDVRRLFPKGAFPAADFENAMDTYEGLTSMWERATGRAKVITGKPLESWLASQLKG